MTAPVDDAGKNNICAGHSTRFRSSRRHAAIFGACWPEVPPHSRSISGGAGRRWAADDVVVANAISIGKYLHISIRPALSHVSGQAGVTVAIQQISAQPRRNETEAAKQAALHVGPGCGPETAQHGAYFAYRPRHRRPSALRYVRLLQIVGQVLYYRGERFDLTK